MNKNNIILIGIVLLFLLVIRPMSSGKKENENEKTESETFEGSSGTTHGGTGGSFGDVEAVPMAYTNYSNSKYVQASLDNNSKTEDPLTTSGKTYTL